MTTEEQILDLIKTKTGTDIVISETDIFKDLGVVGDDFHEFIADYQKKYNVKMDKYLWYFHTDEEGHSIGGFFFKAPNKRVTRIPVTPKMLTEFAEIKEWNIDYPDHRLPKYRLDIIFNQFLVGGFVVWVLWTGLKWFLE
jgi:hypothetical protein